MSSKYVNNAGALPVSDLKPSIVTATTPDVALGGSKQTNVFSLHLVVELETVSPKTQLYTIEGWKFDPRIVTSMPPKVGPEFGMRRCILGTGSVCVDGPGCDKTSNPNEGVVDTDGADGAKIFEGGEDGAVLGGEMGKVGGNMWGENGCVKLSCIIASG